MERKMKIKNIRGIQKELFILHLKFHVFFHYLPSWFSGKIGLSKFILLLRRLLYFISKLKHNKFVRWNGQTRLDLYIPGFPTKGFFTACDKFTVFGQKLPSATVLMSVTSGCRFKCQHCYQRLDKGKDIEINFLKDAA